MKMVLPSALLSALSGCLDELQFGGGPGGVGVGVVGAGLCEWDGRNSTHVPKRAAGW
jgi:hypothetical protein